MFNEFKSMFADDVEPNKLYLTTLDGYFLPPKCYINQLMIHEMLLTTSQRDIIFEPAHLKKRDVKNKKKQS